MMMTRTHCIFLQAFGHRGRFQSLSKRSQFKYNSFSPLFHNNMCCLPKQSLGTVNMNSTGTKEFSSTQKSKKSESDQEEQIHEEKERTNESINYISPNPHPDPPQYEKVLEGKKRIPLRKAVPLAFKLYKSTWNEFFDNFEKRDKGDNENNKNKDDQITDQEIISSYQKDVRKNIKENVKVLRTEGGRAFDTTKDITGIRNKDDLIEWSMIQLKLANECVGEFMSGYRKGRDEEIEKMTNTYFQDFGNDSENQKQNQEEMIKPGRRQRGRKSKW